MDTNELAAELIGEGWIELVDGQIIVPVNGNKFFIRNGTVNSTGQSGGCCSALNGGTVNSTNQSGGDCWAESGGVVIICEL